MPERRAAMSFCSCHDSACAFCGEALDVQQDHVSLAPERHNPHYTVPGLSGPHTVHERCWRAVLDHGTARLQERLWDAGRAREQAQEEEG